MRIGQTSLVHFGSQIATSIFGFVVTVYLARELGDAVLGNYFLVVAVLVWLKVLGGQGIQMAVRKRISEGADEDEYLGAGLGLQLLTFGLLAAGVLIFREQVNDYVRTEAALPLVALLFTGLLLWQVRAALEGRHRVGLSSLLAPLDRTLRGILQVGVVAVGLGTVWWLLSGYAVAEFVTAAVGLALLGLRPRLPTREQVASMVDYAKYSWFSGIESRTFASMDTLVLGVSAFAISSGQIGTYEIAWNLASILAVFGASISTTLFPAISELSNADDFDAIDGLIDDAIAYSGLFVVPGLVGCLVVGERVLAIYGPEFTKGYTILVVLVVARLLYVYQSQFTNVLSAIDRPEITFRVNVAFVATNLGLNFALVYTVGWLGAAVATATSAAVGLVLSVGYLRRYVTIPVPTDELVSQAVAAVVMGGVVYAARGYAGVGIAWTFGLVALGGCVYFAMLTGLSRRFRATIGRNLPAIR
ncbi:lipopolysaccharide biosynthesis protein [Halococcus saccharolyticus]|uniref:Polysaccharide biosynthesis protein n=1 Tax=Halococcus saccharolyticus DSM 5350 TaxID=1227455 RepID=M0MIC9_9EURY|nr:lipopolysaccharide biosynthesis protein [Halococcus saccharolyticus]EMA45098.1 polysaccharide biosynthesis protein [Halococcus saccharolyticus DSM 5350]